MIDAIKRFVCRRKGHRWIVVDPEWFEAGPRGEPVVTCLCRCQRCLEYDREI